MESGPYLLLHSSARCKCGPIIPSPMVAVGDISIKEFLETLLQNPVSSSQEVSQLIQSFLFLFCLFVLNVPLKTHEISLGHRQAWLLTLAVFLSRQAFLQTHCRVFHITPLSQAPRGLATVRVWVSPNHREISYLAKDFSVPQLSIHTIPVLESESKHNALQEVLNNFGWL